MQGKVRVPTLVGNISKFTSLDCYALWYCYTLWYLIVIPCGIGLLYPVIGSHHGLGVGGVEESKAVTKFMGERLKKAGPLKIHISVSTFEVGFFM